MTLQRLFNNKMICEDTQVSVYEEDRFLCGGRFSCLPSCLLKDEILELNMRYQNRRTIEVLVRITTSNRKRQKVSDLFLDIIYPHTKIVLVLNDEVLYIGKYGDAPIPLIKASVKTYNIVCGEDPRVVIVLA